MKSRFLLACTLLAFAPSFANADYITQNFSFTQLTQSSGGAGSRIQAAWNFNPFDVERGTLTGVELTFGVNAFTLVGDNNQYSPNPVLLTPSFSAWCNFSFFGGFDLTTPSVSRTGDPVLVAPNQGYGIADTIALANTYSLTGEDQLAYFQSGDPRLVAGYFVFGTSWAGGINIDGKMDVSIKYNYRVPDSGSTFLLIGAAFCLLVSARRYFVV